MRWGVDRKLIVQTSVQTSEYVYVKAPRDARPKGWDQAYLTSRVSPFLTCHLIVPLAINTHLSGDGISCIGPESCHEFDSGSCSNVEEEIKNGCGITIYPGSVPYSRAGAPLTSLTGIRFPKLPAAN